MTFSYPNRKKPALQNINLSITQGAFVTICGSSGCGKTTLLRQLKPSTAPHGVKSGLISFMNTPLEDLSARDSTAKIGFVMQSPDNQIVTDKVWHELAFGLESLGVKTTEIRLRVAEMASFFGIQEWFHKPVTELSGGQKQLLALASIMTMQPLVLILDEPTSQLDPIAAGEFLTAVSKINRELGVTVILTEHRLEEVFPLSTHVVIMEHGRIMAENTPHKIGLTLQNGIEKNHGMFLAMPTPMRVWTACKGSGDCPITVREGAKWLASQMISGKLNIGQEVEGQAENSQSVSDINQDIPINENSSTTAISLDDIWFRYEKNLPDVIKSLTFKGHYGKITAILGGNGTGKTTMLSLISGLNAPYRGKIYTNATVYGLPQNPQALFVGKTVREDLLEILSDKGISEEEKNKKLTAIVKLCRLEGLLDNHPYDLSGGEQQRAALAKVLLLQPQILLLDEPTKGLDAEYKSILAAILRKMTAEGAAIIMVSHDIEFCAEYADHCALFFDGSIVTENTPREFFTGNNFYTTSANRMSRHILPVAVTANDIIQALGGELPPAPEIFRVDSELNSESDTDEVCSKVEITQNKIPQPIEPQKHKLSKRTIFAAVIILLTIPLTIYLGIYLFDDRQFNFISMLIILQTMIPFALVFESRKPQARELVIIAVLCAIAVAGRTAFFMLPQFKPVIAMVIIAGIAFGGESGFLVGAMTGFVSNMFFGQGPWTPWQMFAFGIIGFLAGVLFQKGQLGRKTVTIAIFGGIATFIIYGGIMNPATVLMWQPNPTIGMFLTAYLYGFPSDILHSVGTVFFLAVISRPMLEKLDRIKIKYGLVADD